MAAYDKFDSRVDSLVVEAKTFWDPSIGKLTDEDKAWLSSAVHREPQKAARVAYERAHTGFTREITVTVDDITRLYREKLDA